MSKIGRNDPCWCGSGKKYKQCHLVADEAAQTERRRLKQAGDTLLPRVVQLAQEHAEAIPAAFALFWNNKYSLDQMASLDELEGRGAERFLTWFAFDYPLEDGRTLVEQLAAGREDVPLSTEEQQVLAGWQDARLEPFVIVQANRGRDMTVRQLLGDAEHTIEDQAASRRVEPGEVLIVHLLPLAERRYIGGAAAHLTPDTAEPLAAFAGLHLQALQNEQPGATYTDLLRIRSYVLNHLVMELPVEEPDPTVFDKILQQTMQALELADDQRPATDS